MTNLLSRQFSSSFAIFIQSHWILSTDLFRIRVVSTKKIYQSNIIHNVVQQSILSAMEMLVVK
jgi:hypothetical protein